MFDAMAKEDCIFIPRNVSATAVVGGSRVQVRSRWGAQRRVEDGQPRQIAAPPHCQRTVPSCHTLIQ